MKRHNSQVVITTTALYGFENFDIKVKYNVPFNIHLHSSFTFHSVCFFSFTIGSLASIFNRIDSKEAQLNNKMAIIDEFAKESKLDQDLKLRLRHSL